MNRRTLSFILAVMCLSLTSIAETNSLQEVSAKNQEIIHLSEVLVERLYSFKDLDSPRTGHLWELLFDAKLKREIDLTKWESSMRSSFKNPDKLKIALNIKDALLHLEKIEAVEKSKIGKPYFADVEDVKFRNWLLSQHKAEGGGEGVYNPTPQEFKERLNFDFRVYLQNNGLYPESILLINQMNNNANQKLDPTVKTPVESGEVQGTAGQL